MAFLNRGARICGVLPHLSAGTAVALRDALTRAGYTADGVWCCQGALLRRELAELLALAHDRPTGELVAATPPAVRELVRHGVLVSEPDT